MTGLCIYVDTHIRFSILKFRSKKFLENAIKLAVEPYNMYYNIGTWVVKTFLPTLKKYK